MKFLRFSQTAALLLLAGIAGCKKVYYQELKALIAISNIGPSDVCRNGGTKIATGKDINNNGVLDSAEIAQTQYVCNGETYENDKMIMLPFSMYGASTSSISGRIAGVLPKFNKVNYAGADSITFYSSASVYDSRQAQPVSAVVELYNITDDAVVSNSKIVSNKIGYDNLSFSESENVYNSLPAREIVLGYKISSSKEGSMVQAGLCYLIVYKH